jgi:spore coat protein CotH
VRLTNEEPLDGETELLLNGYRPERQILGMDLWRRAGLPYSRAESVVLVFQGQIYPRYAAVEPIESRYLERHFGDCFRPNLYRGQRTADLSYLGESQALYADRYEKHTNALEHDWTDVVALTRAFALSSDAEFPAAVAEHIDVEEWIRWFAVSTVLGNQEGGLHRDTGDDYYMYRPAGGKIRPLAVGHGQHFSGAGGADFPAKPAGSSPAPHAPCVRAALFSCPRGSSRALVHSRGHRPPRPAAFRRLAMTPSTTS